MIKVMQYKKSNIIVIGGGPAGSTIATLLARKGLSVNLFEKEKFPRPHVGESLLPFCYPIFKELGVLEEMERRFIRKPGACFANQDGDNEMTYCFNKVLDQDMSLSFHVRRDEFDQLLLENSKKNGVNVYEEHRVTKINIDSPNCLVSIVNTEGQLEVHETDYVIDATGRDCFISKSQKTLEPLEDLNRVAVSAHWKCSEIPQKLRSGSVRITYLEGDNRKGWIWCIPIDSDRVSMGIVVDAEYYKFKVKQIKVDYKDWQKEYYFSELKSSASINGIMQGMNFAGPININGNYSYKTARKFGQKYALVGDASQFIDPIFASGVYIAMKSAKLLSDSIYDHVKNNNLTGVKNAYQVIEDGYEVVHELIKIYYDPASMNFASTDFSKVGPQNKFSDHNDSFALIHLLLAGDFFEKGSVYLPFLESLKDRKQLKKWQNLIDWEHHVSKNKHNDDSCGEAFEKIFQKLQLS